MPLTDAICARGIAFYCLRALLRAFRITIGPLSRRAVAIAISHNSNKRPFFVLWTSSFARGADGPWDGVGRTAAVTRGFFSSSLLPCLRYGGRTFLPSGWFIPAAPRRVLRTPHCCTILFCSAPRAFFNLPSTYMERRCVFLAPRVPHSGAARYPACKLFYSPLPSRTALFFFSLAVGGSSSLVIRCLPLPCLFLHISTEPYSNALSPHGLAGSMVKQNVWHRALLHSRTVWCVANAFRGAGFGINRRVCQERNYGTTARLKRTVPSQRRACCSDATRIPSPPQQNGFRLAPSLYSNSVALKTPDSTGRSRCTFDAGSNGNFFQRRSGNGTARRTRGAATQCCACLTSCMVRGTLDGSLPGG